MTGGPLAKKSALLFVAVFCLGADPPKDDAPVDIWAVDAGDTALDYRVPSSACPSEETFRERTSDLYEFDDPFVPTGIRARSLVRIEVTATPRGYRAAILVIDPATGTLLRRSAEEEQERCDDLIWVLSHRMRLVISPKPAKKSPAPARDPKKDEEIQRRLDALEETTKAQAEINLELRAKMAALQRALGEEKKRKMDLTYALSAGALITVNLTSNVGPGAWIGGELRSGPIGLGLELRAILPSRVVIESYDYDFSRYVAYLTPCGRYSYFFGCLILGAGAQLAYDGDFPGGAKSAVDPLVQLGGRVGADIPFGETRFGARLWGEVLYGTPNPEITIAHQFVSTIPEVSAFFGVGLVVRIGKEGE